MVKLVRIISVFAILSFSLCGCGRHRYHSLKPDDAVSRAVYDVLGKKADYHGKEEVDGRICYDYELEKLEVETMSEFVKAVNSVLGDEQEKIKIDVDIHIYTYRSTFVCRLSNYSDDSLEKADYDGLRSLSINDRLDELRSVYASEALTYYTGIKGIRQLEIGIQMQQRADEEGIDWYECWPDLEEIIFKDEISYAVYDEVGSDYFYFLGYSDNASVYCYNYLLKQADAETMSKFVKVVNSVLESKQEKVWIGVFVDIPDERTRTYPDGQRPAEVFTLSNCTGNNECGRLCFLDIRDPAPGDRARSDEQFFPDPAVYMGLEGIKKLDIGFAMQQHAKKEGIDWHECMPDLEEFTVEEPYTLETR